MFVYARAEGDWVTKFHGGAGWDTTGDSDDLDAETAAGAKLLRYPDGTYVHTVHRQYPHACGPASLTMILHALGYADPRRPARLPVDVDELPGAPGETVDVGYFGSMEFVMWLGYHRTRLRSDRRNWNAGSTAFMSPQGLLNTAAGKADPRTLGPNGEMLYLSFGRGGPAIPNWLWHGPAVGTRSDRNGWDGLPGIMNYLFAHAWGQGCRDARPLTAFSRSTAEVCAFRRIVKGFVDQGIPLLLGVESGRHFNVIMGYRGVPEALTGPFYVYTADPLDGWGRPRERLPRRWRRLNAVADNMFNGRRLISQYVCWNQHLHGGCEPGGWAAAIDECNGNHWLCGRPVPERDPRDDPLGRAAR